MNRRFPVMNLSPRLGQIKTFDIMSDQELSRVCQAVNTFNEWGGPWADTATGQRYRSDAIADVQSAINRHPDYKPGAIDEIRKFCDNSEELLDHIQKPGPGTGPYTGTTPEGTTPPPVPSVDIARSWQPTIPPNTNPPVATGQPGPGAGAFYPRQPIATGGPGPGYNPVPTGTTGSEPEETNPPVQTGGVREFNQPPPPPMPPPTPPPVASVDNGCWYVMGQGYSWGPRPQSGEPTGLNQAACQNIISVDRQVRGLPPLVTTPGATVQQQTTSPQTPPMTATQATPPPKLPPPTPPPVATGGPGSCGPGQFWDGTRCRGSVASIPSLPGGLAPSGGAALPPGGLELPPGLTEGVSGISMGSRIPLVRGIGTRALRGGW